MGAEADGVFPVRKPCIPVLYRPTYRRGVMKPVTLFGHSCGIDRRIGKHLGAQQILWIVVNERGRSVLGDAALVQGGRESPQQQCLCRFGGGVNHCGAVVLKQLGQLVAQFLSQLVVQIGEGFVQQHQVGLFHQRTGQCRALLLPTRQFIGHSVQHRRQLQQLRNLRYPGLDLLGIGPHHFQRRGNILVNRKIRIIDKLLIYHGNLAFLYRNAGNIPALKPDLTRGGPLEACHQSQQGGLAGQGSAKQDIEAPLFQLQIGIVDMGIRTHHLLYVF